MIRPRPWRARFVRIRIAPVKETLADRTSGRATAWPRTRWATHLLALREYPHSAISARNLFAFVTPAAACAYFFPVERS